VDNTPAVLLSISAVCFVLGSASWCGMRFSAGGEFGSGSRPAIQPTHRVR
jgi:hypothetical protein